MTPPSTTWAGTLLPTDPPAEAELAFLDSPPGVRTLVAWGNMTTRSLLRTANKVLHMTGLADVKTIVMVIGSQAGELDALAEAVWVLDQARLTVQVVAHVHVAGGPAVGLVMHCDEVVARPQAQIGGLAGTWRGEQHGRNTDATARYLDLLYDRRPSVAWERLLCHSVTGEAAEHLGIVDRLDHSVDRVMAHYRREACRD